MNEEQTPKALSEEEFGKLTELLPLCGCGRPQDVGAWVLALLRGFALEGEQLSNFWRSLDDHVPTMFFVHWANEEGYLEHGGSVSGSWITGKGLELLEQLQEVLKS